MVVRVLGVERSGLKIRTHDSVKGMVMFYSVLYHGVMVLYPRSLSLNRSRLYAAQTSAPESIAFEESQHDACEESDSFCGLEITKIK